MKEEEVVVVVLARSEFIEVSSLFLSLFLPSLHSFHKLSLLYLSLSLSVFVVFFCFLIFFYFCQRGVLTVVVVIVIYP